MKTEEIKNKLDAVGNIKVIFEPSIYNDNFLQKKELQDIIEKTAVSLRGWSFPHIPRQDNDGSKRPYSIGNGVEFYTVWDKFIEIFRFYQSGQFVARFALYEDTIGELHGKPLEAGKYLDFLSTIYKMTEIVLFIRNLMEQTGIEGGNLTIEINKTRDRELEAIFSQNIFSFNAGYVCGMEQVVVRASFEKEKIMVDPLKISRDLIKSIFDDFNWRNYSDQMIETHQQNLLNRRI